MNTENTMLVQMTQHDLKALVSLAVEEALNKLEQSLAERDEYFAKLRNGEGSESKYCKNLNELSEFLGVSVSLAIQLKNEEWFAPAVYRLTKRNNLYDKELALKLIKEREKANNGEALNYSSKLFKRKKRG